MDAARFDALARSLSPIGSRRHALAGTLAGVLGSLGVAETDAKKKCPPCKKRKHGKCKKTRPDGAVCTDSAGLEGTCQRGSCVAPTCDPEGTPCTGFAGCCSQSCDTVLLGGTCAPCRGRPCTVTAPCCGGLTCTDGFCDGCRDRGAPCENDGQCCYSRCTGSTCLSPAGGRCVRDIDCQTCYVGDDCANICTGGACTR